MADQRVRLDQPRDERGLRRPHINPDTFGAWSERLARYFGTAKYLAIQTLFVAIWIAINVFWGIHWHDAGKHGTKPFDPYPFILLNLAFSTQAAYAAPLILLAQNRQTDRDRIQAEADREEARQAKADVEYLARELAAIRITMGEVATRDFLRSELARMESNLARDSKDGKKKAKAAAAEAASAEADEISPTIDSRDAD